MGAKKKNNKKVYPQKVLTKNVHKKCPQLVSTKGVHKKCPQKAKGERKMNGRGAEGKRKVRAAVEGQVGGRGPC